MRTRQSGHFANKDIEEIKALARVGLMIGVFIFFGVYGSTTFSNINPVTVAADYRVKFWFFQHFPDLLLVPIAAITNHVSLTYMIAPLAAITFVIIGGAYFVRDIYNLPSLIDALKYVNASMFSIGYPELHIDKGSKQIKKHEVNLIDKIGGPGLVLVEPGNAAMFRKLRGPSGVSVSSNYFLAPFERLAQAVSLDDQQGDKEEIGCTTRDGIKVKVRDIHFRYRIQQELRDGKTVRRSPEDPYPFPEEALMKVAFNLQVVKDGVDGVDLWNTAVERFIVNAITDFVATRSIDDLTAPRKNINLQLDLKNELHFRQLRNTLNNLGAELLWVDVGHIDIEDDTVDEERANLWAADWVGDATVARAYGEAKRQAYHDLGRAEAQAELILSIADAMSSAGATDNTPDNIRKILLARTAQILDAISDTKKDKEDKEPL